MNTLSLTFAANHPVGAGHFPGNPIVPGALLLAEVVHCIARAEAADFSACNIKAAKFPAPARPGDTVDIEYSRTAQGSLEFRCAVNGNQVLSGVLSATIGA